MKLVLYYLLLVISLLGLYGCPCYPFIESIFVDKTDGHIIVCFGERHTPFYTQQDPQAASEDRDKKLLLALVHKISQSTVPTTLILETRPEDMTKARSLNLDNGEEKIGCLNSLAACAAQHANKIGSAEFIWADNRGPVNYEINGAFSFFSNPRFYRLFCEPFLIQFAPALWQLTANRPEVGQAIKQLQSHPTSDNFDHLIATCPELQQPFFNKGGIFDQLRSIFRKRNGYTAGNLLAEIDHNLASIAGLRENYKSDTSAEKLFASYQARLTEVKAHVVKFFGTLHSMDKPCAMALFKAAKKQSFAYVRDQMYQWAIPLGGIVADVYFLNYLIQAYRQGHHVLFFGGSNHAIELHRACKQLGMASVSAYGQQEKDDKPGTPFSLVSHFASDQLEAIMEAMATALIQTTPATTSTPSAIAQTCATCQKQGADFKRCSACKSVYYCSVDCQGKDWPNHKLTCTKK